ncbi:MAG: DNA polymerase III subunit beta [Methylomicrobium sp.]
MTFIIGRDQILTPLQQIVSVIEKRQTMPILSNVLLVFRDNRLQMTGTDLEIRIVSEIVIENSEFAEITIPARKFLDICRLLPGGAEIKLEIDQDKVKVASGRSRFLLSTLPADNYPEFSETEFERRFTINAGLLKKALEKTVFCMANQDVRYYLNGLLLNISNNRIKLVASDGHRLSVFEENLEQPVGYEARIILPRKGVMELVRLLDDLDVELTVEFSNNNVRVTNRQTVFSAKLVDAKYPDFNRVFHQDFFAPIHTQRQTLKDALTRVAILSNEKYRGVTFDLTAESLKISAHNPEHEEAEEEVVTDFAGDPLTIAFNVQYMLDAISNLDSETAELSIARNSSCCIVEEPENRAYRFIVMPMRL